MTTTPPTPSTTAGAEALDQAERYLAQGALLDAIEAFTAAHRADPSPELAHRIVLLRHGIDDIRYFFQNDLRLLRQFV